VTGELLVDADSQAGAALRRERRGENVIDAERLLAVKLGEVPDRDGDGAHECGALPSIEEGRVELAAGERVADVWAEAAVHRALPESDEVVEQLPAWRGQVGVCGERACDLRRRRVGAHYRAVRAVGAPLRSGRWAYLPPDVNLRAASPKRANSSRCIVALAMLVDRVQDKPAPVKLLGWI